MTVLKTHFIYRLYLVGVYMHYMYVPSNFKHSSHTRMNEDQYTVYSMYQLYTRILLIIQVGPVVTMPSVYNEIIMLRSSRYWCLNNLRPCWHFVWSCDRSGDLWSCDLWPWHIQGHTMSHVTLRRHMMILFINFVVYRMNWLIEV